MGSNHITFISEYCDRWCERCAFTSRCAAYAVEAALGMCGDLKEGAFPFARLFTRPGFDEA